VKELPSPELIQCRNELRQERATLREIRNELRQCREPLSICRSERRECREALRECRNPYTIAAIESMHL